MALCGKSTEVQKPVDASATEPEFRAKALMTSLRHAQTLLQDIDGRFQRWEATLEGGTSERLQAELAALQPRITLLEQQVSQLTARTQVAVVEELRSWPNVLEQQIKEQCKRGEMYAHGDGVPQDHIQAAHWYGQAAVQDHAEAQYRLGDGLQIVKPEKSEMTWLERKPLFYKEFHPLCS